MKNFYTLVLLLLSAICLHATAQLTVDKSRIGGFVPSQGYTPAKVAPTYAPQSDDVVAKAYGIRCYEDNRGAVQELVSFYVNNPSNIKVETDLSDVYIRSAAYADGFYYMINSIDGMCAYHLIALDMESYEMEIIASYDIGDYEADIIFLDMAYDHTTSTMYAVGYDLQTAEIIEENDNEIEVELALLTIDLETGEMKSVGHQDYCNIISLAADNEGKLWGMDVNGKLWSINKENGQPIEAVVTTSDIPSSLQSMCFHPEDNTLYWAGFSVVLNSANGFLSKFNFADDAVTYEKIGAMANNSEIVGLHIDANPAPEDTPAAVSELTVTPDAMGSNIATISLVTPTTLINGEAITGKVNVVIYRDDELLTQLDNQATGVKVTYVDNTATTGYHTYKVACSNDRGEGRITTVRDVFVGSDTPGQVESLIATKTEGENKINILWSAPTTGANGGWYEPTTLTYTVTRYPDEKVLATGITKTFITDTDFTTLDGYTYGITSYNKQGQGATATTQKIVAGPAIELPYTCDFVKASQRNIWTVIDGDHDGHEWFHASYSSTGEHFMKFGPDTKYNPKTPANDWLITPPLKLEAGKVYTLEYDMLLLGVLFPADFDITIGKSASISGQSTVLQSIDSLVINQAWAPQNLLFEVAEDGEYYLGYHARNAVMMEVTNVVVRELEGIDLTVVDVVANNIANVNSETSFDVTIKNLGSEDVEGYIVKIVNKSGDILASSEAYPLLHSQESITHTLTWTPQAEANEELHAVVEVADDEVAENNNSEVFNILVLEEGSWVTIQHNTAIMNYLPFTLSYKYSYTETIYLNSEMGIDKGYIKGLVYYTYVFNNKEVKNFNAKIALANTDDIEPDPTGSIHTQVYSGTIKPTSETTSIYFPFDAPFEYNGGNLSVKAEHASQMADPNLMFYGSRDDNGYWRSWYYTSSKSGLDVSQIELSNEITNVSFFIVETNAVEGIENTTAPKAYLSHGNLFVAGEYDIVNIYSIDGRLQATHHAGDIYIPMNNYANGIYIVEVISNGARSTTKIAVR